MITTYPLRNHFDNFTQLPSYLPSWAWRALRHASVLTAIALAVLLLRRPTLGLQLFWGLAVPLLPMVFMFVPGLWRNLCPLASSNQAPRRSGLVRPKRTLSPSTAYPLGITMCVGFIVSRKLLFNHSAPATAALLLAAMGSAFVGGLFFKGKSGWCSSICPLLPVQRLYGQTPFVKVANTQCEPCVGCMKNCYDFAPGAAYLADQYDPNPTYRNFRRLFAGIFPGLVLGFYLVPNVPDAAAPMVVSQMLVYMACSFTLFTLLDLAIGRTRNIVPLLFAALAFNLYYWFSAPQFFRTLAGLGIDLDPTVLGALRASIAIGSLVWLARSLNVEWLFLRDQVKKSAMGEVRLAPIVVETVRMNRKSLERSRARFNRETDRPAAAPTANEERPAAPATPAGPPELRVEPAGTLIPLRKGQVLLEALEGCGADIKAGCRAGACGADPIAVVGGADLLGPVGSCERATLERLGHAPNTRLACMARLRTAGPVRIELKPHAASSPPGAVAANAPAVPVDRSVQRVVIVGNGVAGLTAAEHARRLHPDCRIDIVGRENHRAYNRMAIARLIHTRDGLSGLQLLPEQWYADQRINAWLATHVRRIDPTAREVELATGERLGWDRLILTTGSSAAVPPIAGFGAPGSFVLRDADDALAIRRYAQEHAVQAAVVVGAGLLGLEAAEALRELGLVVHVLSRTGQVLDRQVDAAASALICDHLRLRGIAVIVHAQARSVRADEQGRCVAMELEDGTSVSAGIVVACAGAQPNLDLARAAGLKTSRGVIVDDAMRTSTPEVFAAGDVAEFDGEVHGLWAVALLQGEIAAHNALGVTRHYAAHVPVTALKVSGINVRSAGTIVAQSDDVEELTWRDRDAGRYAKVVVRDSKVVGTTMVGSIDEADQIVAAVQERRPWAELLDELGPTVRFERTSEALTQ